MKQNTTISELIDFLNEIAPPQLQESYDNSGLIVGNPHDEINGVLTCLDCTEEVVQEAIDRGCNLIVSHHPIVFRGLKTLTGASYIERVVINAIRNRIAIFAIHTNLDNVYYHGVNAKIAEKLALSDTAVLKPMLAYANAEKPVGAGLTGSLPYDMNCKVFLDYLKEKMALKVIRHTSLNQNNIRRIAVCGGAGSFLLNDARNAGVQAYVSADFKYHEFFDAEKDLIIADIGHFESERFTIDLLFDLISGKFTNFAVLKTNIVTNPVFYH